ncbi:hypothetical protein ACSFE6_04765 [Pseudomonas baetica]|uniref:hypothetical protein n=1 Tax=Pseudomonas baetica TaxID=674054 RepID=UPI003EEF9356
MSIRYTPSSAREISDYTKGSKPLPKLSQEDQTCFDFFNAEQAVKLKAKLLALYHNTEPDDKQTKPYADLAI